MLRVEIQVGFDDPPGAVGVLLILHVGHGGRVRGYAEIIPTTGAPFYRAVAVVRSRGR
jgi:hypothetical protein